MNFNQLVWLPKDCKKVIERLVSGKPGERQLRKLFDYLFVGTNAEIKYSLESVEKFQISKRPSQVWRAKRGHCFETSLFLLACLRYLGVESKYYEIAPCVMMRESFMTMHASK